MAITKSIHNMEQHKIDLFNKYKLFGEHKAKEFVDFYSGRYDIIGKGLLDHKIAWLLFDDYCVVKKTGIRWYAVVGTGGTGKTTLAKNVCYYLDNTFSIDRIHTSWKGVITSLSEFGAVDSLKSVLLDEPDKQISAISKEGRLVANILGKARQQQVFMVYCATDLNDIPNFVYKKLTGIFFTPRIPEAMFFKDRPKKYMYPLSEIKREYYKKGYAIFFKLKRKVGCVRFHTRKDTSLNDEQELAYKLNKQKDYEESISKFLKGGVSERDKQVLRMVKLNFRNDKIAAEFNLTERRIRQIIKAYT